MLSKLLGIINDQPAILKSLSTMIGIYLIILIQVTFVLALAKIAKYSYNRLVTRSTTEKEDHG